MVEINIIQITHTLVNKNNLQPIIDRLVIHNPESYNRNAFFMYKE